ncbi:bifunctional 2-polyprenyl-6-hydroxyphenol methylase/3-demethylubiquinol 3-O-methyltransferase UbiG [Actinokineospora sp. UTMC 2448]|uniref:class I SAM-dependent methyltransferase n=1 Tax=Actinokineospora sp. UTMC 2448 TaxID=2268449 RepID=UPI00216494C1|nr:class I SAM-dependent methyltransferase [Actinokineospora sp. UTMC 2448]
MARIYDRLYPAEPKLDSMIEFLVGLCPPGGRVLELGVGTGRVAVPLAACGIRVSGIDLDPDMLAVMKSKPGGDAVEAVQGDFTTDVVGHDFDLVVLAMNTLFAVPTQDAQCAALTRVAEQLADTGRLVLEHFDPNVLYRRQNPLMTMRALSATSVLYFTTSADFAKQGISAEFAVHDEHGVHTASESGRYIWPSELDVLARLAGLRLVERHGGWERQPVPDEPVVLVSVYAKG